MDHAVVMDEFKASGHIQELRISLGVSYLGIRLSMKEFSPMTWQDPDVPLRRNECFRMSSIE